jgi:hypothetical protein
MFALRGVRRLPVELASTQETATLGAQYIMKGNFSPTSLYREHNVRVTPKRAFWEAFATVCLPSLILWTIFAYFLRTKLNLAYAEALPIYLFLAILPMPLTFPVYRRYLKGTSRNTRKLSPRLNFAAILFAVVGTMHAGELPSIFRSHKDVWDVFFHAVIGTVCLGMSVEYVRRATRKQPSTSA